MSDNKNSERLKGLTLLSANERRYPASPEEARLETFENLYPQNDYVITFDCPEYTSLCPVTGQPDFGHIIIRYIADKRCVESKSLKLYLFSFRNSNTFHEESVNRILTDFVAACLASASSYGNGFEGLGSNKEAARKVGALIAERALAKGISAVVFDRGGYIYHGRVSELAEGAREGGLKF